MLYLYARDIVSNAMSNGKEYIGHPLYAYLQPIVTKTMHPTKYQLRLRQRSYEGYA